MAEASGRRLLWPTLIAMAGVAILTGLGTWQVHRLHWKEALIASMEARGAEPPLESVPFGGDPAAIEYRRIRITGSFSHDKEMYLQSRVRNGAAGLHVVTPLVLGERGTVLVDRGWVPPEKGDPETRPEGQVEGPVVVEGVVRLDQEPGLFTPDNRPDANQWYRMDTRAMGAQAGFDVVPFYIAATTGPAPGGFPIADAAAGVQIVNNHLQYALTWYALAVALSVIYLIFVFRKPKT
ncbi:MAG: SURF1 family protein [Alphaproteobacteria bacterium]